MLSQRLEEVKGPSSFELEKSDPLVAKPLETDREGADMLLWQFAVEFGVLRLIKELVGAIVVGGKYTWPCWLGEDGEDGKDPRLWKGGKKGALFCIWAIPLAYPEEGACICCVYKLYC